MVSMPDLKLFVPSAALGGLGVVGREGIGVAEREMTPFSLLSLDSVIEQQSDHYDEQRRLRYNTLFDAPNFQDIVD